MPPQLGADLLSLGEPFDLADAVRVRKVGRQQFLADDSWVTSYRVPGSPRSAHISRSSTRPLTFQLDPTTIRTSGAASRIRFKFATDAGSNSMP